MDVVKKVSYSSIKYIDNPSENVIFLALEKEPYLIKYIKESSEEIMKFAIRKIGK